MRAARRPRWHPIAQDLLCLRQQDKFGRKYMPTESASVPDKKTCFVVMGFGKKVDFETGKTFDLDMTYQNIIKPAVEAAGVECIRADDIIHAGVIDVPMYEHILAADL